MSNIGNRFLSAMAVVALTTGAIAAEGQTKTKKPKVTTPAPATQTAQPAPVVRPAPETDGQKYARGEKFIDDNYNLYLPALTAPAATPEAAPAPKPGTVQLHNPFAVKKNPLNERIDAAADELDNLADAVKALSTKTVFVTGGDPVQNGKNVELGRVVATRDQDALDAYTKSMGKAGQLLSNGSPDADLAVIAPRNKYFTDAFKGDPSAGVETLTDTAQRLADWADGLRVAIGTDKPAPTGAKAKTKDIFTKKILYTFHENEVTLVEQLVQTLKQTQSAAEDIAAGKPIPTADAPAGPVNPYGTPAASPAQPKGPVDPYAAPAKPKPQAVLQAIPLPAGTTGMNLTNS